MNSYYAVPMTSDYIYHHGIIGQKWGVRRFQNSDGSLTSAGKERYGQKVLDTVKKVTEKRFEKQQQKAKDGYDLANSLAEKARVERKNRFFGSESRKAYRRTKQLAEESFYYARRNDRRARRRLATAKLLSKSEKDFTDNYKKEKQDASKNFVKRFIGGRIVEDVGIAGFSAGAAYVAAMAGMPVVGTVGAAVGGTAAGVAYVESRRKVNNWYNKQGE